MLSLAAAVLFFMAYKLWFSWFVLILLLVLPLLSLLASLPALRCAKLDGSVFSRVPVGACVSLELTCGKFPVLPWRCKMLVSQPLAGGNWLLREGDSFPTENCGALLCTIQKLKVYDYLGLFSRTLRYSVPLRVFVHPATVPVPVPRRTENSAIAWKPKWGGGFSENHELRLYQPGDSLRQIHWKLSAKTGELIFRQPMDPVRNHLLIWLDLSGSPQTLDRKLGKLLWLGRFLSRQKMPFRIQALAGDGAHVWSVSDAAGFAVAFDELLCLPFSAERSAAQPPSSTEWQYYIGGDDREA